MSATTHAPARMLLFAIGALFAPLLVVSSATSAQITSGSGSVELIAPPPNVREDQVQSNTVLFAFDEQQNVTLTSPLWLNAGGTPGTVTLARAQPVTVPTGTRVNSHLVFLDPVGRPAPSASVRVVARMTFDSDVLGLALRSATLTATDWLGTPGTVYPTTSQVRGLETGDRLTISPDRRTVSLSLIGHRFDQVRIITEANMSLIDQEFTTTPYSAAAIFDNGCCNYIAQTFTAGRTGHLTGVNVDVHREFVPPTDGLRVRVAIRTVTDTGQPSATTLGEVLLPGADAPLDQLIAFTPAIPIQAGTRYAIVVNFPDAPLPDNQAYAHWWGASNELATYAGGQLWYPSHDGVFWPSYSPRPDVDLHFRTYVVPSP